MSAVATIHPRGIKLVNNLICVCIQIYYSHFDLVQFHIILSIIAE